MIISTLPKIVARVCLHEVMISNKPVKLHAYVFQEHKWTYSRLKTEFATV